jgi:hypothetical protein
MPDGGALVVLWMHADTPRRLLCWTEVWRRLYPCTQIRQDECHAGRRFGDGSRHVRRSTKAAAVLAGSTLVVAMDARGCETAAMLDGAALVVQRMLPYTLAVKILVSARWYVRHFTKTSFFLCRTMCITTRSRLRRVR